jgi:hypothetical protein
VTWKFSTGHRPEEDLAKFGYRQDMKVQKKLESFYILATLLGTCYRTLAKNNLIKNLANEGPFLAKNIFVYVEIVFFRSKKCENSLPK